MNGKVFGILVLLILLCSFMAVMTAEPWYQVADSTFLKPNNIENLLRRTSLYGILGIGVAFVIISSGIDLSIGSMVCLSGALLAIFLHVDYRAIDELQVLRVDASARQIAVRGTANEYEVGDAIRYSGGRRARSAVFTVARVEGGTSGAGAPDESQITSVITVEESIRTDDRSGQVASAHEVLEFANGDTPDGETATVTLAGRHPSLRPRDELALVHPAGGLNQLPIIGVEVRTDRTVVTVSERLGGNFSTEWVAIPLKRHQRLPIAAALASVLGIALALGLLHGVLITQVRLQPFVVTLCGLLIYRGVSRWIVNDQPVGFGDEYEHTLSPLGAGKLTVFQGAEGGVSFGIPYPCFILVIAALLAAIFLNRTIWGRYLLALGRNEEAARYSGINTVRITMSAYVISTVLAATGGILFSLDSNSISPASFGNFFELYAIAAAVLGGCSLRGGEGSIAGVLIGTAVMQVLYNLIVLLKISGTLEFAIIGAVILVGVVADELVKRLAARRNR